MEVGQAADVVKVMGKGVVVGKGGIGYFEVIMVTNSS